MPDAQAITLGMPVFNGQNYLEEAICSLLEQTLSDFQLLISDNGSTDQTEEICRAYAKRDSRVRYVRQPRNLGAVANFNWLAKQACSRYFKWAAHDDLCAPSYLEECVSALDESPGLAWCHTDSDMVDEVGQSWLPRLPEDDEELELDAQGRRRWKGLPRRDYKHERPSRRFAGVLLGTRWCVDSYGVIRTDVLQRTNLIPSIYGGEKVLMGELSLLGKTNQVPRTLFQQRVHQEASAYQDRADAQIEFTSAKKGNRFTSTRLALLRSHWRAVANAKLGQREKLCCCVVLMRYIMQISKWKRILSGAFLRKGVGGGGRRIIESGSQMRSLKGDQG